MFHARNPLLALCVGAAMAAAGVEARAQQFSVTHLVTDDPSANPAQITDAGLVNAWGISFSSTSPFWVSSNGTGTSDVYRVNPATQAVTKIGLTVAIPGQGNPTGQVFNAGGSGQFGGDTFLFVSEDGTVSGWQNAYGSTAQPIASLSASFKGAAYASVAGSSYLYAADFHNNTIDVFKGSVTAPVLSGGFSDPLLPAGYAPFNVQALGKSLYVAYAMQDPNSPDEVDGPGFGLVDQYSLDGNLIGRVATGGALNAPWGLAIAPSSFGALAGALLVGNFGDGRINAFNASTYAYLGQLDGPAGQPLAIDGLWGLSVGNDGGAGSSQALYFTAGPGGESHGLFGVIQAVPEPGRVAMFAAGLALLGWRRIGSARDRPAAD